MTKQELIDAILKLAEAELQGEQKPGETKPQSSAQPIEVKDKSTARAGEEESAPTATTEHRGSGILYFPDEQQGYALLKSKFGPQVWTFTCPYHRRGNLSSVRVIT